MRLFDQESLFDKFIESMSQILLVIIGLILISFLIYFSYLKINNIILRQQQLEQRLSQVQTQIIHGVLMEPERPPHYASSTPPRYNYDNFYTGCNADAYCYHECPHDDVQGATGAPEPASTMNASNPNTVESVRPTNPISQLLNQFQPFISMLGGF